MNDINMIANDIAIETKKQGEKLAKIDDDLAVADKNAEEGVN
jgi:t-SNARE complex subunit (syntaxin)